MKRIFARVGVCFAALLAMATVLSVISAATATGSTPKGTPQASQQVVQQVRDRAVIQAATAAATTACKPYAPGQAPQVVEKASTAPGSIGVRKPAPHQPSWNGDDRLNTAVYVCSTHLIVAGGKGDSLTWGGKSYPRHNLFIFDAITGRPSSLAPNVDGEIRTIALASSGTAFYIGGTFHHVNGKVRNNAAEINLSNGALLPWNPNPNASVYGITVRHNSKGSGVNVIITGTFSRIRGATATVSRSQIASVNAVSGLATRWLKIHVSGHDPYGGGVLVRKPVMNHHGTALVMFGDFNYVGGYAHRRIAVLHLSDSGASLLPWWTPLTASNGNANYGTDCSKSFAAPELDAAWTPDDRYFVTVSTGGPNEHSICDSAAKWDGHALTNRSAKPLAQQFTGGDSISAVVCTNYVCYISGHFRFGNNPLLRKNGNKVPVKHCSTISPVDLKPGFAGFNCKGDKALYRPGVMEISVRTMQATAFNPGRSLQRGMSNCNLLTPQGLWIFSDGNYSGFGKDAYGHKVVNTPKVFHNDMELLPFPKK